MRLLPFPSSTLVRLGVAVALLFSAAAAAAAPAFRIQAPELIALGATAGIADIAAGDVNHDGIPELAVFESDRRVHVYQRLSGAWTNVYTSSAGASVSVPANATPTVRFTDVPDIAPGPGFESGQFLFNAQLPGVAIVSIRLSGGTWSEQTLFGPLPYVPVNGAFSPPVQMSANFSTSFAWRIIVPGANAYDPLFRVWLPRFGDAPPYPGVARNWCEQVGGGLPDAVGADVDGNGTNELVLLRPNVLMLTSTLYAPPGGDTGCWPFDSIAVAQNAGHVQLLTGKFDGDAQDDLVVRDSDGRLSIVWFAGGGPPYTIATSIVATAVPPGANVSTDVIAADVDADGALDLVQAYASPPGFEVLRNDASRGFVATFTPLDPSFGAVSAIALLDADGDGHLDLALAQPNALRPRVLLLPGDGVGGFGSPDGIDLGALQPSAIAADDFDQDGAIDIAVGGLDGDLTDGPQAIQLLHAAGGGAFDAPLPMNTPLPDPYVGVRRLLPFVQDPFTGRSLAAMQAGGYGIAYGQDLGLPTNMFLSWLADELTGIANGDLDGEPSENELVALVAHFDGTSTIETPIMSPVTITGTCSGLALVDWDRDGHLDLVTLNRSLSRLEVHLQSASAPLTFPTVLTYALAIDPVSWLDHGAPFVVIDDPGGSGYVTLVALGMDPGTGDARAQVFHNRAPFAGVVLDISASPVGISTAIASGDVDGDGVPDVVFGEVADGMVEGYASVWRGVAGGPLGFTRGATFVVPDAELNDLTVADVTGDGHADLLCATYDALVPNRPHGANVLAIGPGAGGRFAAMPARQVPVGSTVSVPAPPPTPRATTLALAVGPNPLAGRTARVAFTLPAAAHVTARVLDVAGRVVRTLADGAFDAGSHVLALDAESGDRLASGVYFVQVRAGRDVATRRLVVVH